MGMNGPLPGTSRQAKSAFFRGARESFYKTTRNDSWKWEKRAAESSRNGSETQIIGVFEGFVGRLAVFGHFLEKSFLQKRAKKGVKRGVF